MPHTPDPRSSEAVGPSDSSDSGSDVVGTNQASPRGDSDRAGTGEGRDAQGRDVAGDDGDGPLAPESADRVVEASEAGLGGGLDQAEEARLKPDR